jgi:cellulose synthase/poly-beta-1,6-N-acetylglucosamine synthase-like glycosyltransferase
MESSIGDCVAAIRASEFPPERLRILVVADHCNDHTVARAREAGASVLERRTGPAGKTYALAWTFETLRSAGLDCDYYVITDATARVHRGFMRALMTAAQSGEEIVVGHSVLDSGNRKWFAKCLGLTLVHRNLQNWARERLRLSSLIEGRGMAYSRNYIGRHGWDLAVPTQSSAGQHPTEDWRHGVRVVEEGYRVAYADDARVYTPLRGNLGDATRQGMRWERGRQLNAMTHGLRLLQRSLRTRDRVTFFAALDAIQLPVAILGVLCVALATLAWALPDGPALNALGVAPVILMAVYGVQVTLRGRLDGIPASTVIWAPFYLLWRFASFALAWTPLDRLGSRRGRPAR